MAKGAKLLESWPVGEARVFKRWKHRDEFGHHSGTSWQTIERMPPLLHLVEVSSVTFNAEEEDERSVQQIARDSRREDAEEYLRAAAAADLHSSDVDPGGWR